MGSLEEAHSAGGPPAPLLPGTVLGESCKSCTSCQMSYSSNHPIVSLCSKPHCLGCRMPYTVATCLGCTSTLHVRAVPGSSQARHDKSLPCWARKVRIPGHLVFFPSLTEALVLAELLGDQTASHMSLLCVQGRRPDPLQAAPMLKGAHAPAKQQFSLAAEAGLPADMISAYLPQREQLSVQSIPAGRNPFPPVCAHPAPNPTRTSPQRLQKLCQGQENSCR